MGRASSLDAITALWLTCGAGKGLLSDGSLDDVLDVVLSFLDHALGGAFDEEVELAIARGRAERPGAAYCPFAVTAAPVCSMICTNVSL